MNVSFWTELLIDKCSCLTKDNIDSNTLIIHKECSLKEECKFFHIKNILLSDDPPQPLTFITALVTTEIFTEKQIKKICMSVFELNYLQLFRMYKNFLKHIASQNFYIVKDSEEVLSLKKNEIIE